jgi:hypothetical protein
MIDSNSYYQARVERRYVKGVITRRERDEAIKQNQLGKRIGAGIPGVRVRFPNIPTTT